MILLRDNRTGRHSVTVTCLILTFTLTVLSVLANLYLLLNRHPTETGMIWACIGFMSPFAAIYWHKRFKASVTGLEFGGQDGIDS